MIHINGREYFVRYSLNALLCLEVMYKPLSEILQTSFAQWTIEDVLQLARAAMCSLPNNRKAVAYRNFEAVEPYLAELGELIQPQDLPLLRVELMAAIIDAMPKVPDNVPSETPSKAFHEGHQRALFCDVMGRSEAEFWDSTNREIAEKIDCYLEVSGHKEAAEMVQEFDDD